jgi:hypothetical protein
MNFGVSIPGQSKISYQEKVQAFGDCGNAMPSTNPVMALTLSTSSLKLNSVGAFCFSCAKITFPTISLTWLTYYLS